MKMLIQITMEIISSTWSEEDFKDVKGKYAQQCSKNYLVNVL